MALQFPTRILTAIDRTTASYHALSTAWHLAEATESELHIAYVVLTSATLRGRPATPAQREVAQGEGEAALEAARSHVAELGGRISGSHLRSGESLDQALNRLEAELGIGLLVLGAPRASGAIQRLVAGPESTEMARRSTASILVVRPPGPAN